MLRQINSILRQTNLPNESEESLEADGGRRAEIDLMRQRLLSAGSGTFKCDLGSENKEGDQDSGNIRFSLAIATVRSATLIPGIHGWLPISPNVASTS